MATEKLDAAFKLSKAKARLIADHPFYASIACSMPWIEDNNIPTMATDGKQIYWNRAFVDGMTERETLFVSCHEVLHCVFQHVYRLASRNRLKWNFATDYVINDMLTQDRVGDMPKGGLLDPALVAKGKNLAENVYDLIPDPPENGKGANGQGPLDELLDPAGSPAEQAEAQAEMQVRVAQAAQAARMCGKLSAGVERLVGEVLKPKVNWKDVARRFVAMRAKVDYSFARPKRRFAGEDIYLASMSGERVGSLAVAVDCSGSIGQRELDEFAAEVRAICEDMRPYETHVIYFDSSVSHYDKYEAGEPPEISMHGGGGTAFSPIFKYIDKHDIEVIGCIVLTDLCCSDFGPAPGYPVLWVTNCSGTAPWGDIVEMNS